MFYPLHYRLPDTTQQHQTHHGYSYPPSSHLSSHSTTLYSLQLYSSSTVYNLYNTPLDVSNPMVGRAHDRAMLAAECVEACNSSLRTSSDHAQDTRTGLAPSGSAHACASASITLHVAPAHLQVPLERRHAGDVGRRRVSNQAQKINEPHADTTPATRLRVPMPPKRVPARRRRQRQIASHCGTTHLVGLRGIGPPYKAS